MRRWSLLGAATAVVFTSSWALADPVPADAPKRDLSLFEVGVAVAGVYTPDYPASSQSRAKYIPVPYLVYRGSIFRADREGTRARLFHSDYATLDLSAAASFSARSSDDEARQGMPNLDYLFELGPRLSVPVSDLDGYGKLMFLLPVRAVFSTDLTNLHDRGYTITPALFARIDHIYKPDWIWLSQISGNFASRQLMSYFYDVAPAYVTPTRAFYNARAGYMGTDWFNGLAIPLGERVRLIAGIQIWSHTDDANRLSPLFRRETTYTSVVGVSYTFFESKRLAKTGLE